MNNPGSQLKRFLEELRRRRVFRATAVYVVVAIGVVEVANNFFPALQLPSWTVTLVVALAILGLPVTVALSWAFDIRPSEAAERGAAPPGDPQGLIGKHASVDQPGDTAPGHEGSPPRRGTAWGTDEGRDQGAASETVTALSPDPRLGAGRCLAVLPFETISPDPAGDAWFVFGVREEIGHRLMKLGALTVRPPETVRRVYGDGGRDLSEIAAELRVPMLLVGSVRVIGDRFRLVVRLVGADGHSTLWQDSYDGDYTTGSAMFDIQSDVAGGIASALGVEPTAAERPRIEQRPTENAEAWILYRQGRFQENKATPVALHRALELYQKSIEEDSTFGQPYAGIASAYSLLSQVERWRPEEYVTRLTAAADRALGIDSTLADPYRILGEVKGFGNWDFSGAERDFEMSLRLNPNAAMAHTIYAQFLDFVGRNDEAIFHVRRAQEIDPVDPFIAANVAGRYYFARQYDQALAEGLKALEIDPGHWVTHWILGGTHTVTGDYDEAITVLELAVDSAGGAIEPLPSLAAAYARSGRRAEAKAVLTQMSEVAETGYVAPSYFAIAYAGIDETDRALDWLERAYESRDMQLIWVLADPMMDGLRSYPRFEALRQKIGLRAYVEARSERV